MSERRQIRRAAEEALTDPRLRTPAPPQPDEPQRTDLPPGFAGRPTRHADDYDSRGARPAYMDLHPHPHSRLTSTQLQFRMRPTPWYRTNAAKIALLVLGVVAAVVSLVVLFWPTSSGEPEESGTVPSPEPSSQPSTTTSLAPSARPPVLLPPPPPPTTTSETPSQQYYPPYYPQQPSNPPRINVTRTPMSVEPEIRQRPRGQ